MILWQVSVSAIVAVAIFYAGTQFRVREQHDDELSERIDEIIGEIDKIEGASLKFWLSFLSEIGDRSDGRSLEDVLLSKASLVFELGELEARVHRLSSLADLACRELKYINFNEYEGLITQLRQAVTFYGPDDGVAQISSKSGRIVNLSSRLIVNFRSIRRSNLPVSTYVKVREFLKEHTRENKARYWDN